jgi:RsiW-degrading membrane proteinase PrsW (M82 family)
MAKGNDRNYVSIWFWMLAMLVVAIPCVGWIMIVVWAFVGENESRKNYFRALLIWFLLGTVLWLVIIGFGFWPTIQEQIQSWIQARANSFK